VNLGAHVWAIERHDHGVRVNIVSGDVDGAGRRRECVAARALILATDFCICLIRRSLRLPKMPVRMRLNMDSMFGYGSFF